MESTQKLFDLATTGKTIPHVRLLIYSIVAKDGNKAPAYSALMSDVRIVSLNWTGKGGDKPTANVTLDYRSIEITKSRKAGGNNTVINGWDQVTNKSELSAPT